MMIFMYNKRNVCDSYYCLYRDEKYSTMNISVFSAFLSEMGLRLVLSVVRPCPFLHTKSRKGSRLRTKSISMNVSCQGRSKHLLAWVFFWFLG